MKKLEEIVSEYELSDVALAIAAVADQRFRHSLIDGSYALAEVDAAQRLSRNLRQVEDLSVVVEEKTE